MPAPSEPETGPQLREEVVLKLGDILPRVPVHLLRPGPHDGASRVRFSVDELAEKISRGRVSVPLERLASVCPGVFRDADAFPGEQEIQLPLQKLLEQVGMIAPKAPSPNGVPGEQVAQARSQAGRIAAAAAVAEPTQAPPPPAAEAAQVSVAPAPAPEPSPSAQPQSGGIAKSISSAILSLFGRSSEPAPETPAAGEPGAPEPAPAEKQAAAVPEPPKGADQPAIQMLPSVPPGCISLRVLPIFRLMSAEVLHRGGPSPGDARVNLPLAGIEPQLAEGHVEIPLEEFIEALPKDLRASLNPVPGVKVWIPLDEIFQSLPQDHLFYMPPLDLISEPAAAPAPEPAPVEPESAVEKTESEPAPAEPAVPPPATSAEPSPPLPAEPPSAAPAKPAVSEAPPAAPAPPVAPEPTADLMPLPEPTPRAEEAPPAAPAPEAPASRAPWMRGFQVPPPRLFSAGAPLAETPAEPAPAPPPAPTPEARRTVDFLASQPGVFAAAAFVEGAVFASADFPRKPDLDALRDFMGMFVDHARESGKRLGWNHILTIGCDQYHLTAVVRESHFIVALHHERMLTSSVHDSLVTAANDLGMPPKPATQPPESF